MRFKSKVHNFTVKGAIFDVDDTLLDNWQDVKCGLHEKARIMAAKRVGKELNINALVKIDYDTVAKAYKTASEHHENSIIWQTLLLLGVVSRDAIDTNNIIFINILYFKNKYYDDLLGDNNYSFKDSVNFVKYLKADDINNLAIASNARKADIDTFLVSSKLDIYFNNKNIISKENISKSKPHPEAFELAFNTLILKPQD
ncbi:MAG: hypothetical protein QG645_373, partial [Patescibacteria group bacterium]|nr:hypothetical protein [Patescibacteria group bacterium]